MFGAAGLRTHIWNNNLKSILLLAGFPVLLTLLGYAVALLVIAATGEGDYGSGGKGGGYYGAPSLGDSMMAAVHILPQIAVFAVIGAGIWFIIAWFGHQAMINASTGARGVSRKDEPRFYNLLENLCISRGMTVPKMAIIETEGLNAYASGLTEGQYTVTVTRGLMNTLNDAELEGVLAHELSHIRHRDVRLLVIAIIFVGIISFAAEIAFRGMFYSGMRGGGRRSGSRNGGALVIIAIVCIAVAYLLAILIRFSLSRRREYMADAGAVELTRNPDAMISALAKISGHSEIAKAPEEVREMFIENPSTGFMGVFATHPPIEKRIEALVKYAGGHLPSRASSVPQV